jgi:hypothetical protein
VACARRTQSRDYLQLKLLRVGCDSEEIIQGDKLPSMIFFNSSSVQRLRVKSGASTSQSKARPGTMELAWSADMGGATTERCRVGLRSG